MEYWLLFSLLSIMLWSLWAFLPKISLQYLRPEQIFGFETIGGLLVALLVLAYTHSIDIHPLGSTLALLSGLFNYGGVYLYIRLISQRSVGVAAISTGLYPLIAVVLGIVLLSEPVTLRKVLGVLFGLFALALILYSDPSDEKKEEPSLLGGVEK